MAIEREETKQMSGIPCPPWMSSMSDITTQVLCFFVMLFAFFGAKKMAQLERIEKKVEVMVKMEGIEGVETHIESEKGLVVSLKEKILFETGKAGLSQEAKTVLDKLYPIFLEIPNTIIVEGHTDNVPIKTVQFPSNWELSTARATQVVKYLIEEKNFPKEKIAATGYGEYHPVASNETAEGRAENRRVDFIIEPLGEKQKTAADKLLLLGTKQLRE